MLTLADQFLAGSCRRISLNFRSVSVFWLAICRVYPWAESPPGAQGIASESRVWSVDYDQAGVNRKHLGCSALCRGGRGKHVQFFLFFALHTVHFFCLFFALHIVDFVS